MIDTVADKLAALQPKESSDLVKRLRNIYELWSPWAKGPNWICEAADRIEALEVACETAADLYKKELRARLEAEKRHQPRAAVTDEMVYDASIAYHRRVWDEEPTWNWLVEKQPAMRAALEAALNMKGPGHEP